MQYKAIINGETVDVSFERTAAGIQAEVAGRIYSLGASVVRPGIFLLQWGTRSIEVSVFIEGDISTVFIGGHCIPIEILDSRKSLQRTARRGDSGSVSEIRSPMPGKIVRVLMEEGAAIAAGQGIVVMEAMKMQNEIKSSMAGKIGKIAVAEGETVRAADLIAVVEAIPRSD